MECNREREIVDIATIMRHGLILNKSSSVMDGSDDSVSTLGLLEFYAPHTKSEASLIKPLETSKISDIFNSFVKNNGSTIVPKFILIEGAPGMGKTMLCKEIAYQWAKQCLLKDTKLLFLIHLRDLAISNIKHLKDLVHYLYAFDDAATELSSEYAKILNEGDGNSLTMLFDGFDEFDSSSDTLITNILDRKVLPQCRIVVTSRLTASDRLHRLADVRVEVMGFTDESKIHYIKQELQDHPDEVNKLQSYFDNHPSIKSICYMPMMMTILVYVFKEKRCLPNNPTELYEIFVALTISHHLQKQRKSEHLFTSLQTLPVGCKSFLSDLSKFAFLTLQSNQKVFGKEDVEKYCPNSVLANSNLDSLGLIKSVEHFCIDRGHTTVFNFLHLSIHEYLAALYISSIDQCMQFNELESTFLNKMYEETWNMFIGMNKRTWLNFQNYFIYCKDIHLESLSNYIANVKSSSFAEWLAELCDNIYNSQILSNTVQMLLSQDTQSSNSAANTYQQHIYLSLCSINCVNQIDVQMYVIDKTTKEDSYTNWFMTTTKLWLTNRFSIVFYVSHVLVLYRVIQPSQLMDCCFKTLVQRFLLIDCHISKDIMDVLKYLNLHYLLEFIIVNCTFDHGTMTTLATLLENTHSLSYIRLQRNSFSTEQIDAMCSIILNSYNLKTLDLSNNNLHGDVIKVSNALKHTRTLERLNLTDNNIPESAATAISTIISSNTSLKEFCIGNNELKSSILVILQSLSRISSIQKLELCNNLVPEEVGIAIGSLVLSNTGLKHLLLNDNNIGKGVLHVTKGLQQIDSLEVLSLGNIDIPKEVSDELALVIHSNRSLNTFLLYGNDLRNSAVILQALSKISSLTTLNLQSNQLNQDAGEYISSIILNNAGISKLLLDNNNLGEGVLPISKALQQINSLQVLSLGNNNLPKEVCKELALIIECNQCLSNLGLYGDNLQYSTFVILQALGKISSLRILNLQTNQLDKGAGVYISSILLNNTGLKELLLDNNNLGEGVLPIAKALQQVNSLQILGLGNNNLSKEVYNELALIIEYNQCLHTLGLYNDNLQYSAVVILQALSKISSVRRLNLQQNQLNEDAGEYISHMILHNTGLNEFLLDRNNIGKGMLPVAKALQQLHSLQVLGLSYTNMPKEASDDLALAIECNKYLYSLRLDGNNLQSAAVVILKALCNLSSLKVVNLELNQLTEDSSKYLSQLIFNNPRLKELVLNDNNIGKGVLRIVKALHNVTSLKRLGLGYSNYPIEVCDELILAIQSNQCLEALWLPCSVLNSNVLQSLIGISTLRNLNLNSTQLLEEAGEVLSSIILHNTRLEHLYLSNNSLGNGALHVMKAIQHLTQLRTLHLSNVTSGRVVSEECGEALSYAMSNNNHLEDVDLSNNNIQAVAVHVVKGLQQITSLKVLNLGNSNLPKEISADLAHVINCNKYLEQLLLFNNSLSSSIIDILQALSRFSTLKVLDLQGNQVTKETIRYLSSVVMKNNGLYVLLLDKNNLGQRVLYTYC